MQSWIEAIRLTYNNLDIKPGVFLCIFFRTLNIYVFEQFQGAEQPEEISKNFFLNIHLISSHYQEIISTDVSVNENDIYVWLDPKEKEVFPQFAKAESYQQIMYQEEEQLLRDLAKSMICLVERKENKEEEQLKEFKRFCDEWESMITPFVNNQMAIAFLVGKCFYPHAKLYDDSVQWYCGFIDALQEKIQWNTWDEHYFIKLTILHAAYEVNFICKRNTESIIFDSRQLIELCEKLERKHGETPKSWLLKGQIYEHLLDDLDSALMYYEKCIESMPNIHAYAYYLSGYVYEQKGSDYEKGLRYYEKALKVYPYYYRVSYRMATCQKKMGKPRYAMNSFEQVYRILLKKYTNKVMRPMEIEYWYKISCQLGEMADYILQDLKEASRYYCMAEAGWNMIEQSEFFTAFFGGELGNTLKMIMKQKIDSRKMYEKNILYAGSTGDYNLVEKFKEKLRKSTVFN